MKNRMLVFFFILIASVVFAQIDINDAVSVLGEELPENFTRLGSDIFADDSFSEATFFVYTKNNIILLSSIGRSFDTLPDAHRWIGQFYTAVENQNWIFDQKIGNSDVYKKEEIYFAISPPFLREIDSKIVVGIYVTKYFELLSDFI